MSIAQRSSRFQARGAVVILLDSSTRLGRIGCPSTSLPCIAMIAVDAGEDALLGVAHARIWTRLHQRVVARRSRDIEGKESHRWIEATAIAGNLLGRAAQLARIVARLAGWNCYDKHLVERPCAGAGTSSQQWQRSVPLPWLRKKWDPVAHQG
jgi:hypothetical protein